MSASDCLAHALLIGAQLLEILHRQADAKAVLATKGIEVRDDEGQSSVVVETTFGSLSVNGTAGENVTDRPAQYVLTTQGAYLDDVVRKDNGTFVCLAKGEPYTPT